MDPAYGFTKELAGLSVGDARVKVTEALKAQGFGVLTEIDVQATFKAKLGIDYRPYLILGACNPNLAKRALDAEPGVGLLLPCNVVVTAEKNGAVVSIADPKAMFRVLDKPELAPIAAEAEARLRAVLAAL